jgi:hypothetical protein
MKHKDIFDHNMSFGILNVKYTIVHYKIFKITKCYFQFEILHLI